MRIVSGASYRLHCLPLANDLNLFLVHDVIYIALCIFMSKVFTNKVQKFVVDLFVKFSVYSHNQFRNTQYDFVIVRCINYFFKAVFSRIQCC